MHLTLAVPDLLAAARGAPDRVAALARLARYAPAPSAAPGGFDAALLSVAAGTADAAVAPFAALGAGFDPGRRTCCAPIRSRSSPAATTC